MPSPSPSRPPRPPKEFAYDPVQSPDLAAARERTENTALLVEEISDGVATLTFNRPDRLNALSDTH
jgi:hypothetical protein